MTLWLHPHQRATLPSRGPNHGEGAHRTGSPSCRGPHTGSPTPSFPANTLSSRIWVGVCSAWSQHPPGPGFTGSVDLTPRPKFLWSGVVSRRELRTQISQPEEDLTLQGAARPLVQGPRTASLVHAPPASPAPSQAIYRPGFKSAQPLPRKPLKKNLSITVYFQYYCVLVSRVQHSG